MDGIVIQSGTELAPPACQINTRTIEYRVIDTRNHQDTG